MKKWISRIILMLAGLIVGVGIGAGVVYRYTTISFQVGGDMLALNYAAWEGEEAYYHYKKGNYKLAEQSFSHLLKVLVGFEKLNEKMNRNIVPASADISFTHVRLGNIAENNGERQKAKEHFNRAVTYYKKHCDQYGIKKEYTVERLRELVEKIDSNQPVPELRPFSSVLYVAEE